jgi:hypothetical protein
MSAVGQNGRAARAGISPVTILDADITENRRRDLLGGRELDIAAQFPSLFAVV